VVDGQQVPIKASADLGSIEIELSAGTHRVTLDFLETEPRRRFRLVSLCSVFVLLALGVAPVFRRRNVSTYERATFFLTLKQT
jgi:lipopolysaccharide export LptBFGC system permease protein LptF